MVLTKILHREPVEQGERSDLNKNLGLTQGTTAQPILPFDPRMHVLPNPDVT